MRELPAHALCEMPSRAVSLPCCSTDVPWLTVIRPKKEKYPDGYPGDQGVTNPIRTKVNRKCGKCEITFQDEEQTCGNCGHEKCDSCPRAPPIKAQKPGDEAAVQSVEERMRNLEVSPQALAA